jgi:metallo-beta-lactamase family protein
VIIPSFALERAQEVVYAIKRLHMAGRMPAMPVYVDSPLTVKITEVFRMHPECFDHDARAVMRGGDSPFDFDALRYVESVEESKAISASNEPAVIISASGMCEAGRVLHHLRATVAGEQHTVLIVGFQAQHTLGRRLVERRDRVRIFGLEHERRCEVVVLNGFSAHADQANLVAYAEALRRLGPLRHVALVHGEPKAQTVLRGLLDERGFPQVAAPAPGDRLRV